MIHGSGLDLWRSELSEHGLPYLSEARYLKVGPLHAFEWWLNEDHFYQGQRHGIERSWNPVARALRRAYPEYWVHK
jgi:hypothetical protein